MATTAGRKLTTLTCLAGVLAMGLGAGVAQADEACDNAWRMASPDGKTISEGQTVDYVLNFTMVDTNEDGKLDQDEFGKACGKGLIKADAVTEKDMN